MKFRFYPKGRQTVVVMNNQAFTLYDAATSNWTRPVSIEKTFEDLPLDVMKETSPLRAGKKSSTYYWGLPYREACEVYEFLEERYKGFGRHNFWVGQVPFHGFHTSNEVGEPYLCVTAALPKHVIEGICACILSEYKKYR